MARITNDKKWAPVIGKLMIAFGSIEHSINEMILEMCAAPVAEHILGSSKLADKLNLLQKVVPTHQPLTDEQVKELSALIKKIKDLSEHRNTVAHYPLHLDVFLLDTKGFDAAERISRKPGNRTATHVTFDQLVTHAADAESIASRLIGSAVERSALGFNVELFRKYKASQEIAK